MSDNPISAFNDALLEGVDRERAVKLRALVGDARGRDGIIKSCIRCVITSLGVWVVCLIFGSGFYALGLMDYETLTDLGTMAFMAFVLVAICLCAGYDLYLCALKDRLDKIIGAE